MTRLQSNTKVHSEMVMQPQKEVNSSFLKNTNGFLCAAPGCEFLSQNLDRYQDKIHYNILHRNLTFTKDSFIAMNAEMTKEMEIFNEAHKINEELPK